MSGGLTQARVDELQGMIDQQARELRTSAAAGTMPGVWIIRSSEACLMLARRIEDGKRVAEAEKLATDMLVDVLAISERVAAEARKVDAGARALRRVGFGWLAAMGLFMLADTALRWGLS